jgi:hypothetical protein
VKSTSSVFGSFHKGQVYLIKMGTNLLRLFYVKRYQRILCKITLGQSELDFEPPNFKLHDRLFVEVLTFSDGYVILEFAQSSWHLMTNKNHVGAVESLSGGARGLMFFLL